MKEFEKVYWNNAMYGIGWSQIFFTTRTSISMDIEHQTKRMMTRHDEQWPWFLLLQENGCSGGNFFWNQPNPYIAFFQCTFSKFVLAPIYINGMNCNIQIKIWFVDRGQERVRKSVLEKCNVWTRLISKFFCHQNVGFNGHRTTDQEDDEPTRWEMTLLLVAPRKRMFRW